MIKKIILIFILLICGCKEKETLKTNETLVKNDNFKLKNYSFNKFDYDKNFTNYQIKNGSYELNNINDFIIRSYENGSSFYNENIYLKKSHQYNFSFEIDIKDALVELTLEDEGKVIFNSNVENGFNSFDFVFKNDDKNIKFNFNIKNANEIKISNIELKDYDEKKEIIRVNQLGYKENDNKTIYCPYYCGDFFSLINQDGEIVYQGKFYNLGYDENSKENIHIAEIENFKDEGEYYIKTEIGYFSHKFKINNSVYNDLFNDSLKMIKGQRCGTALDSNEFGLMAHDVCHSNEALLLETLNYDYKLHFDVSGGWHDAGDYGRYTQTINKVLNDLILSYFLNNKDPNLLPEIHHGLNFLLKMQEDGGGIYNKVVTKNFAPIIYPDKDNGELYIFKRNTSVSANAVMIFNMASIIFEKEIPEFAHKLSEAANKSYEYVINHSYEEIKNPSGFNAGYYSENYDEDERFNANVSMYLKTKDSTYLEKITKSLYENKERLTNGFNYDNTDGYGKAFFLLQYGKKDEIYSKVYENYMDHIHNLYNDSLTKPYRISSLELAWGSNYRLLDDSKAMLIAYKLTNDINLKNQALSNLHYVLGTNPLNMSYVTGYGSYYPRNIHHRITMSGSAYLSGALVGGVNRNFEDPATQAFFDENKAIMSRYLDVTGSYSTNEVAIYYNSPLYFVLGYIEYNE